jgi:inorganic pyrophosphatase
VSEHEQRGQPAEQPAEPAEQAEQVDVVVEIPRGSRNKYEFDPEQQVLRFNRRLPGSFAFPADYGYVPDAVGSDGEPLDALVLLVEPAYPGVWVRSRAIGVVWIRVSSGRREAKMICVPDGEPAYDGVADLGQLPDHLVEEITNFFDVYRSLDPESSSETDGVGGASAARELLRTARERARRDENGQASPAS